MKFYITVKYPSNPFKDEEISFSGEAKTYEEAVESVKEKVKKLGLSQYKIVSNISLKREFARILGQTGGISTLKKYGKVQMKEWGKKGGRPKKLT